MQPSKLAICSYLDWLNRASDIHEIKPSFELRGTIVRKLTGGWVSMANAWIGKKLPAFHQPPNFAQYVDARPIATHKGQCCWRFRHCPQVGRLDQEVSARRLGEVSRCWPAVGKASRFEGSSTTSVSNSPSMAGLDRGHGRRPHALEHHLAVDHEVD